jgi:hypothetical protein
MALHLKACIGTSSSSSIPNGKWVLRLPFHQTSSDIVSRVIGMQGCVFPVTHRFIMVMVAIICEVIGLPPLTPGWYRRFTERHPILVPRQAHITSRVRNIPQYGHDISNHRTGGLVRNNDMSFGNFIAIEVVLDDNVLGSAIVRWVLGHLNARLVVFGNLHDIGVEAMDPEAFLNGQGKSNVLGFTVRQSHCGLFLAAPADGIASNTKDKTRGRFSVLQVARPIGITAAFKGPFFWCETPQVLIPWR